MSSEIPEVRQVLRALAAKVNEMPLAPSLGTRFTEESQAPLIDYEERHMNTEHLDNDDDEHSRFKSSVVEYMLSGQNIGNALWGLRNTTSEHEEVREALAALSVKISQSNAELNGQNIGNALYSLHSMDGEAAEVRAVLGCLAHKIVVSKQPLSGLDIGMSLFGLRSMNAEIPEVPGTPDHAFHISEIVKWVTILVDKPLFLHFFFCSSKMQIFISDFDISSAFNLLSLFFSLSLVIILPHLRSLIIILFPVNFPLYKQLIHPRYALFLPR